MRHEVTSSLACALSLLLSTLTLAQLQQAPQPSQIGSVAGVQAPQSPKPDARLMPRFALMVGINKYADKSIPELTGSENDVTLLKETLIKDYGFDEKNILTLLTSQATREAILTGFRTQ